MTYCLTGPDGEPYESETPGVLGGNGRGRIYGRLDCPSALRALRQGGTCLRADHAAWKAARS